MCRLAAPVCAIFILLCLSGAAGAEVFSSISGRLIDQETGEGISGCGMMALGNGTRYTAITDENGFYVLEDLPPGGYVIGLYEAKEFYVFGKEVKFAILEKGKNTINVNFELSQGGAVSGTVYAEDGITPLEKIAVVACENGDPDYKKILSTDANGKFSIYGLPENDECVVEIRPDERGPLYKTVQIAKGIVTKETDFVVTMDDITGVSGQVISVTDNRTVKNIAVILYGKDGTRVPVYTNEEGKYAIVGVEPGIYLVVAFWPGADTIIKKKNILVESGKSTVVNFEFEKPYPWDEQGNKPDE